MSSVVPQCTGRFDARPQTPALPLCRWFASSVRRLPGGSAFLRVCVCLSPSPTLLFSMRCSGLNEVRRDLYRYTLEVYGT